jgi:hypothetical protein
MSNPITDLKRELLTAAERQHAPAPVSERRFRGPVRAPRLPIGAAVAVAAAAAAALFLTAPWSSSPGFLERAAAALIPPKNSILHAKLAETSAECGTTWTAQVWIDERTQRFRGFFHDPLAPVPWHYFTPQEFQQGVTCSPGSAYEAGSTNSRARLLRFQPKTNRLVGIGGCCRADIFGGTRRDPVADLRRAIRAGLAHDEGRTKLHGRTVERIRVDSCPPHRLDCPDIVWSSGGGYAYVDPKTYVPVEIRLRGDVTRITTYEYLPRTAANLALTDIRAQHPHARLSAR